MELSFADWLVKSEAATGTADVATFARPTLGIVRRTWPGGWGDLDPFFRRKKRQPDQFAEEQCVSTRPSPTE